MTGLFGNDVPPAPTLRSDKRHALRGRIDSAKARLFSLPPAEQKRLYEASREKGPAMYALIGRLEADPLVGQAVRVAVERSRAAPSEAELGRAIARELKSAFRAGRRGFRPASAWVLAHVAAEFGLPNARRITLGEMQKRYLAAAARDPEGCDGAAAVMAVTSLATLWAGAQPVPEAPPEAMTAPSALDGGDAPVEQQLLVTGLLAACYHIELGVKGFAEFAEAMAADLGDMIRPHLRGFYEAIRHYPGVRPGLA